MKRSGKPRESAWEQSRKLQKKKIFKRIILVLPILSITGILIVNNRDLITGEKTVIESNRVSDDSTPNTALSESRENQLSESVVREVRKDTVKKKAPEVAAKAVKVENRPVVTKKKEKKSSGAVQATEKTMPKSVPLSKPDSLQQKQTSKSDKTESREFSIELPSFPCSIENRKDIVISLSLELFYTNSSFRDEILFRRNEIKVMVLRVMQNKVLPEMKIMVLEKDLLKDVNSIFDQPTISRLKIRNIQIEKVSTK